MAGRSFIRARLAPDSRTASLRKVGFRGFAKARQSAAEARQSAIRRMPLEELGLMFCVWLAWAGQLAHMALLSEREDE
jgi:hypothetical protein